MDDWKEVIVFSWWGLCAAAVLTFMMHSCVGCDVQRTAGFETIKQLRIKAVTECIKRGGRPLECREALK